MRKEAPASKLNGATQMLRLFSLAYHFTMEAFISIRFVKVSGTFRNQTILAKLTMEYPIAPVSLIL
jgi:hypothetical protein